MAYWPFDGNANDASGNGNHGTTHGVTLTTDRFGNENGAYYFDGDVKSFIEVPNSPSLQNITQRITISAWIKPSKWTGDYIPILSKGDIERQYGLQFCRSGTDTRYDLKDEDGVCSYSSCGLSLDAWQHVVVTYDGNQILAYKNGECIGTDMISSDFFANTENLYIGRDYPGYDEDYYGALDDLCIYNRALSAAEVKALYDGTTVTPTPTPPATGLWTVTQYDSTSTLESLSEAEAMIMDSSKWARSPVTRQYSTISFENYTNGEGDFAHVEFPGTSSDRDSDDFAIKAEASIWIPRTGYWTFATSSDDGQRTTITGNGVKESYGYSYETYFYTTTRTIYIPSPGEYSVDIVYYELAGSAQLEFSVAVLVAAQPGL